MPNPWTWHEVADWLSLAADTLRAQPHVGVKGFGSSWPEIADKRDYPPDAARYRYQTTREGMTALDRAARWTLLLQPRDYRIVWLRAFGLSFRKIANIVTGETGKSISHDTARRDWELSMRAFALVFNRFGVANHEQALALRQPQELQRGMHISRTDAIVENECRA